MNLQGIHQKNVYVNVEKIIKLQIPIGPIGVNQFIQLIASLPQLCSQKKGEKEIYFFLEIKPPLEPLHILYNKQSNVGRVGLFFLSTTF